MTTILTSEKLQEITPITNALANQLSLITPFVEFAEVAHLKQDILGEAMYDDIITHIENGTLSGANETLVVNYLYNLSGWLSFWEALPFIAYRSEAKGLTKKFSENSQPLDREEVAEYRQSIWDKSMFWKNATLKYLANNKASYPLLRTQYFGKETNSSCDDGGYDNSSGIFV